LPKPAGALMTPSRLAGSSRKFGQDGEEPRTCDQPPESCGHGLGRQEWQLSSAGQGARSICKMAGARLDQGLPLSTSVLPPSGGYRQWRKCTIFVSEREALGIVGYKHPAAGRRVLIPLGKAARREPKQAYVYQERTLGFRADD